jgi:hypothetical protein
MPFYGPALAEKFEQRIPSFQADRVKTEFTKPVLSLWNTVLEKVIVAQLVNKLRICMEPNRVVKNLPLYHILSKMDTFQTFHHISTR